MIVGDDGFAKKVLHHAVNCSKEYPRQYISFPSEMQREDWKQFHSTGGKKEYLVPFVLDKGP